MTGLVSRPGIPCQAWTVALICNMEYCSAALAVDEAGDAG